jgi:hypothetical protein
MTVEEITKILSTTTALPAETEIVEFKEAKTSYHFDKIGKYFFALSSPITAIRFWWQLWLIST